MPWQLQAWAFGGGMVISFVTQKLFGLGYWEAMVFCVAYGLAVGITYRR